MSRYRRYDASTKRATPPCARRTHAWARTRRYSYSHASCNANLDRLHGVRPGFGRRWYTHARQPHTRVPRARRVRRLRALRELPLVRVRDLANVATRRGPAGRGARQGGLPLRQYAFLARMALYPGQAALDAARTGADDGHALVRLAALEVLEAFPPRDRVTIGVPLLGDRARAVRQGAAWVLAPVADSLRTPLQQRAYAAAAEEFVTSQRYNADRACNRLSLAAFFAQRRKLDSAVTEYTGRPAPFATAEGSAPWPRRRAERAGPHRRRQAHARLRARAVPARPGGVVGGSRS